MWDYWQNQSLGLFSREQFIYLWIEINKLKIARLGSC